MELIPPPWRGRAWCSVAGLAAVVVGTGLAVHGDTHPLGVEVQIERGINTRVGATGPWRLVFTSVIPWAIVATLVALAISALSTRRWRALVACAAVPLAIGVTEVLKPIVGRGRPSALGYPSGHVTAVAATATAAAVIVGFGAGGHRRKRLVVGAALLVSAGAVLAAVASHAHRPIDAVAGLPTGAAVALAWVLAIDAFTSARARSACSRFQE